MVPFMAKLNPETIEEVKTEELHGEKEEGSSANIPSVGLPLLVFYTEPLFKMEN